MFFFTCIKQYYIYEKMKKIFKVPFVNLQRRKTLLYSYVTKHRLLNINTIPKKKSYVERLIFKL